MRPLYIDGVPGCRVVLDEPALRIVVPDKADQLFPLSRISRIVCKGVVEWSMSAMLACTDAGINLIFLYKNGDVRARWLSVGTTRQSLSQRLIDLLARADGLERYENWYLSMYKLAVRSCARKLNFDNWREIPIKEMEQFVMSNLSVAGKYQVKLMLGIVHSELLVLLTDSDFGCDDEAILSEQLDLAADILLYGTEVVPVGEDQKQHVELARDLAKRFNHKFGETFIVPKAFIKEEGMRVMGLDDPSKKMSKSATSEYNYISLTDDVETVKRKIKKAVTDSGSGIIYSDEKPALKNLINIFASFSGKTPKEIEVLYVGKGYGDFKTELAEVINNFLTPFQEKLAAISDEEALSILRAGAEKVRPLAKAKLDEVKKKVGFIL